MNLKMDWRDWLYSLVSSGISGFATSITTIIVDPAKFNLSSLQGFLHLLAVGGLSAFFNMMMLLKQSPLPPKDPKGTN